MVSILGLRKTSAQPKMLATNLLQVEVVNVTSLLQLQQVITNLSISSSCNKSVKIRLVATCHLLTCYNSLKQLAEACG